MPNILIIDDDTHISEMLTESLQAEEYSVSAAYSGTEALLVIGGVTINVLPILMTVINLISGAI